MRGTELLLLTPFVLFDSVSTRMSLKSGCPISAMRIPSPSGSIMAQEKRAITGKMWGQILWKNGATSLFVIGFVWALFVADLLGFNLRSRGQRIADSLAGSFRNQRDDMPPFMPIGVTVIVGAYAARWINRGRVLAQRGEFVSGTVRRMGGIVDFQPLRRVEFSYMLDGKAYRSSFAGSQRLSVGAPVQLVVDPKKPKRVMFQEHVFPPGYRLLTLEGRKMEQAQVGKIKGK